MTRRNPPIPEPPSPPDLPTLDVKATWHNRAGRVDRSCCFVLTAASLWRQLPDECWRHTQHVDAVSAKRLISGQSTGHRRHPDRVGSITLSARDLWHYHRFEKPSPLRGDFRTTKANAFKPAADATRWWKEVSAHEADASRPSSSAAASHAAEPPANQATPGRGPAAIHTRNDDNPTRQTTPSPLDPPAINPNRGAGFAMHLKMLGLGVDWSTTLRLERYVQHAKLKQHFLVCPVCGPAVGGPASSSIAAASHAGGASLAVAAAATRVTPGRGPAAIHTRGDTSAARQKKRPSKLPPGRVTKLFLPLCTPREWEDAQLAHLWLATHTNPNRPHTPGTLRLINRYAELFPGRQLRCRQCLGLRYGEVKGLK